MRVSQDVVSAVGSICGYLRQYTPDNKLPGGTTPRIPNKMQENQVGG